MIFRLILIGAGLQVKMPEITIASSVLDFHVPSHPLGTFLSGSMNPPGKSSVGAHQRCPDELVEAEASAPELLSWNLASMAKVGSGQH